jgi:hypothetical protein
MVALCALLFAVSPEVQIGLGAGHSLDSGASGDSYPLVSPAVQGRLALDFLDRFAIGAEALAILDGEAPNVAGVPATGPASFKAFGSFITLRMHSQGTLQWWFEGGAGPGHLISLQQHDSFEHPPTRGKAGPDYMLGTGLRFARGPWKLDAGLSWIEWTNVEHGSGGMFYPARTGLTSSALLLLIGVAFAP